MSRLAVPAPPRLGNELALLQPRVADLLKRSIIITIAVILLLAGLAAIRIGDNYYSSKIVHSQPVIAAPAPNQQISGLNQTVPSSELPAILQSITNQAATLAVGDRVIQLSPDTIRSWLTITHDNKKSVDYIHINAATIAKSLNSKAGGYVKSPVNQVTVDHGDGSSQVIVTGRDGTQLTDPSTLTTQANEAAKTVMDGNGLKFSTPMTPLAFQSVTPAAFEKMIEVNVVTKQMYLYQNGNLFKTYAVSAGAPATPTPIGQFKIFSKPALQDMKGNNPDGSKYLQPHVRWINYFLPGGYAIHGNYWRPASVFGAVNTSHGCVSLPESQAKDVYDWAPIGTTVITHY